jgi:hypothetical protein
VSFFLAAKWKQSGAISFGACRSSHLIYYF